MYLEAIIFIVFIFILLFMVYKFGYSENLVCLIEDKIKMCDCDKSKLDNKTKIQHNLLCDKFRKLNPDLTVKEFLETEGIVTDRDFNWPTVQQFN